jgi:hypothetical protein
MTVVPRERVTVVPLERPVAFTALYQWIDAVDGADRLTVAAGYEVLNAYESGIWHEDVDRQRQRYLDQHNNTQPPWSARSSETFYAWLQARAAADGHSMSQSRAYFQRLRNAAEMHRYVSERIAPRGAIALPPAEGAWRPLTKFLTGGAQNRQRTGPVWDAELIQAVELAVEIAEEEGKPEFTAGVASKARGEVWRTAPRIRQWVEQPNKPKNDESNRDISIRLMHTAQRHAEPLRDKGRPEEVKVFRDWVVAWADKVLAS